MATETSEQREQQRRRPVRAGVFDSLENAEAAFAALREAGFTTEEVSVLCSDERQKRHFPEAAAEAEPPDSNKAAAAGGALGGLLGGVGAAAGLATVAGIPVVVAGALGAALGGGVAGGLTGVMVQRGFEKESADYFDQAVTEGKILISIEPAGGDQQRLDQATQILREQGAQPLSLLEG